jgi:dTDP-4-amino-4,6-dideoxygalactose transaminase
MKSSFSNKRVPVWHPSITAKEKDAVCGVFDSGYLGMGANVFQFERAVAERLGVSEQSVVSTHTGQSALHLALLALGIGSGDTVITPSFNNIADFQAILATGATPYFCDIDSSTGLVSAQSIKESNLTNAKAIIILDYASQYCDLAHVSAFARDKGLKLVYDAAHSFGSIGVERLCLADATMFSFDPIKTITAIDAGIIYSPIPSVINEIRKTRHMGMEQNLASLSKNQRSSSYEVNLQGYRYHLSNVHAAVGCVQIERFNEISHKRISIALETRNRLDKFSKHCKFLNVDKGFTPFMNVCLIENGKRDKLKSHLEAMGIQTGIHWKPGHHFRLLEDYPRADLSGTDSFYSKVLSLPLYADMDDDSIVAIVEGFCTFDSFS